MYLTLWKNGPGAGVGGVGGSGIYVYVHAPAHVIFFLYFKIIFETFYWGIKDTQKNPVHI